MSTAALTRFAALRDPRPLSARGAWHRLSMIGTLIVLLVFPWATTRGCDGNSQPTTWTGIDLLAHTAHNDTVWLLGPAALLGSALIALVASRARVVRDINVHVAASIVAFVVALGGAFGTFIALELPIGGDVAEHHPASAIGIALLLAFIADALVRVVFATREWWRIARRRR